MLSIQNITAGYGDKLVLHDLSMTAEPGQFIGLIGPNGSGKTTLLRVISGILNPIKGKVLLHGEELAKIGNRQLAKTMACLSQDLSLDLSFTVRQITLMGRSPHLPRFATETKKDFEIAENAMQLADVSHLSGSLITEISGGERQRALIAMCLAQQPQLLLLDEPTSHLDIGHQLSVLDLLKKLNRQTNVTVIAVFHDLNLAAEYCQVLLLLDNGHLTATGTPEQVLSAEMIQRVYDAKVITQRNPVSNKPHIVLTADMNNPVRRTAGKLDKINPH